MIMATSVSRNSIYWGDQNKRPCFIICHDSLHKRQITAEEFITDLQTITVLFQHLGVLANAVHLQNSLRMSWRPPTEIPPLSVTAIYRRSEWTTSSMSAATIRACPTSDATQTLCILHLSAINHPKHLQYSVARFSKCQVGPVLNKNHWPISCPQV
jgi:hypothetical protein